MNMYSILLFASTGLCCLLHAADAPKDVVAPEAEKTAAALQLVPAIAAKAPLQKDPYAGLPRGCLVPESAQRSACRHVQSSQPFPVESRSYWSHFPGAGHISY